MPCIGGPSEPAISISKSKYEDFEMQKAILCAALSFIKEAKMSDEFFAFDTNKYIDWAEIGINPEIAEKWWETHKKEDLKRKELEKIEKEKKDLREKALKKLTKEEKKVLGLK